MPSLGRSADDSAPLLPRADFDEAELVRRAQLGSSSAFEQLVVTHGPHLYRYLAVRLGDDRDARDALQETFTAAWRGLPSLKSHSKFWPWLVGIAAHKAADAARDQVHASEPDLEKSGREYESTLDVREAVAALPEHLRQVLLLRYLLQLSEQEVAEALGIRVGTVKSRSARARKALMELLR